GAMEKLLNFRLPSEINLLKFSLPQTRPEQLIAILWHGKASIHTVRTHIKTLRRKIDLHEHEPLLKTLHGVGYCLSVDNTIEEEESV
ncbi:MAG: helix-turn-helix domain-containing protein, partial [Candidatus Obscuribacterales bacterium]|nr:helix-turn-helix domain-containing protein [Candidatus Obscuribacterales bacterium]